MIAGELRSKIDQLWTQFWVMANKKGVYKQLLIGDIRDTHLEAETYDVSIEVLADEHLSELFPLYREAARITKPNGHFVIVGPAICLLGLGYNSPGR